MLGDQFLSKNPVAVSPWQTRTAHGTSWVMEKPAFCLAYPYYLTKRDSNQKTATKTYNNRVATGVFTNGNLDFGRPEYTL